MGKGKIAAQVGHATQDLILKNSPSTLSSYISDNSAKIVLKVPTFDTFIPLLKFCQEKGYPYTVIKDAGRTQIPAGSATVLGIGVVEKEEMTKMVETLKLL